MRYDRGYGREYGAWGGMPGYDRMFRGRERHGGPPQGRRGRDAGRMGWRDVGPAPREGWNQHPAPGETDFLGRPYPPAAMDDRPWGLIEQDRVQARHERYDRGFRGGDGGGYDRGFGARPRYAADYGRPEDYRPRFSPDRDVAGVDAHRYARGGGLRDNSHWTRWF